MANTIELRQLLLALELFQLSMMIDADMPDLGDELFDLESYAKDELKLARARENRALKAYQAKPAANGAKPYDYTAIPKAAFPHDATAKQRRAATERVAQFCALVRNMNLSQGEFILCVAVAMREAVQTHGNEFIPAYVADVYAMVPGLTLKPPGHSLAIGRTTAPVRKENEMDDTSYVAASTEARNLVIGYLSAIAGDGGRSDEDDAKLREVINELRCLNDADADIRSTLPQPE